MATLEYYLEYDYGETLPGEQSVYIHLRLDLPSYYDQVTKEDYFSALSTGQTTDETVPSDGGTTTQTFTLDNSAPVTGTIVGTLYKQLGGSPSPGTDTEIQTFTTDWDGTLDLTDVGSPSTKATSGEFATVNKKITLNFNLTPIDTYYLVVSYYYTTGTPVSANAVVTGLFNIPGIIEVATQAYRVWLMKSPLYQWTDIIPAALEFLRSTLGQDEVSEMDGSGIIIDSSLRRDL
jgi:hypothetical protein